jgi:transposase
MSTTTKSPKKLAVTTFKSASKMLPPYAHKFSPKKFTQPQLFACLVLKTFYKTDYRGIMHILLDSPELCETIGLSSVPHWTTLQKASVRLLRSTPINALLASTAQMAMGRRKILNIAALDSTGLESGHISPYFYKIRSKQAKYRKWKHFTRWPKLALIVNVANHMILTVHPTRGPRRDCCHFKTILKKLSRKITVRHLIADAGYDSEASHVFARELLNIKTIIPATVGRAPRHLPNSCYRRRMKTHFDNEKYHQRWQVETVFSMIKRLLGCCIKAHDYQAQCREIRLLAVTHNLMLVLFFYLPKSFSTKQKLRFI